MWHTVSENISKSLIHNKQCMRAKRATFNYKIFFQLPFSSIFGKKIQIVIFVIFIFCWFSNTVQKLAKVSILTNFPQKFFTENSILRILPSLHSQEIAKADPGRVKQRVFGPQGFGSQGFWPSIEIRRQRKMPSLSMVDALERLGSKAATVIESASAHKQDWNLLPHSSNNEVEFEPTLVYNEEQRST